MPVSKQTRKSRHEQAENPTLQRGNPASSEGRVGTQQFRNIAGKGLVHMVRSETGWKEMGSSQSSTNQGDKVESTTISAGVSATSSSGGIGGAVSVHGNLTSLGEDDHSQYVHLSNVRTISGNHVFSGAPQFNNIDVNGGDIASGTTINKSPVITLAGDLGGNATLTNLGNATLTATIQPNSVALATDTTGNYMINVTGNSQVSVSHSQGEGSTAALSIADDSIGDTQLAYNTGQHLTTSSAVTFATVNTGQGDNELYDMNQNVLTSSDVTFNDIVVAGDDIRSDPFSSGFTGSGWSIDNTGHLSVGSATIRGTLSVFELLIQQIRASNGAIFVTSSAKVDTSSGLSASDDVGTITFEDPNNNNICPFADGDIIMMQRVKPGLSPGTSGNIIKKLVYEVDGNPNGKTITVKNAGYNNTSSPSTGDDFVRIGNTGDTANRDGVLYLTSDDDESPFIDIKASINSYSEWNSSSPKVRLGKLDGITDTDAGLNGSQSELYGLYSDNVYLKGHISASTGSISNSVTIGGTAASTVKSGAASGATAQQNGSAKTAGTVGGWTINSNNITGSNIVMSSSGNIAVSNGYSLNNDGSASFSNGNITFATNGDITSTTYLVERTRLFGGGEDGVVRIHTQAGDGNSGSTNQDSWYAVDNADGTRVLLNQGAVSGNGAHWYQLADIYATDFTVRSGTVLYPRGFRIFCKGTLTVESGAYIYNLGSTATNQSGAAGGIGANLSAGTAGKNGGNGGEGTQGVENKGGYGGGAGGSGGMILISARYISNSGTIAATGGNGANGQNGSGS